MERRLKILSLLLPLMTIGLFTFQNCGRGFKAAGVDQNSTLSFSKPGSILPLNLFAATNSISTPVDTDLSPYVQSVTVENLRPGSFLGNGRIVVDTDDEFASQLPSPSNLIFKPSEPQFAAVNAYYHTDRLVSSLSQLGVFPSSYPKTHVNVHCSDSSAENNSYFDPSTDILCLGFSKSGSFTAWAALDADVIVHEFGHSINAAVATDKDTLTSSQDLWALDEGIADVWAYLQNGSPYIGRWFGYILTKAVSPNSPLLANFKGLRDLTTAPNYPAALQGESHDDSVFVSTIFSDMKQAGVPAADLKKLAIRVLSDLQYGDTFADVVSYIKEEAASLKIDSAKVNNALTARNLLRKDSLAGLSLSAANIFVVDNHYFNVQKGGNCNAKLDAGETAILFLNLANSGSNLGTMVTRLTTTAPATEVSFVTGGDISWYSRINQASTFLQSFPARAQVIGSSSYLDNVSFAGYAVKTTAAAAGKTYPFNLQILGFNSVDSSPVLGSINFSLQVGSVANITGNCPGAGENNVWPR